MRDVCLPCLGAPRSLQRRRPASQLLWPSCVQPWTQPFTAEEVVQLAERTPPRKAVVGPLAPWLLKPARQQMAPLVAAEFNAWRRSPRLPIMGSTPEGAPMLPPCPLPRLSPAPHASNGPAAAASPAQGGRKGGRQVAPPLWTRQLGMRWPRSGDCLQRVRRAPAPARLLPCSRRAGGWRRRRQAGQVARFLAQAPQHHLLRGGEPATMGLGMQLPACRRLPACKQAWLPPPPPPPRWQMHRRAQSPALRGLRVLGQPAEHRLATGACCCRSSPPVRNSPPLEARTRLGSPGDAAALGKVPFAAAARQQRRGAGRAAPHPAQAAHQRR